MAQKMESYTAKYFGGQWTVTGPVESFCEYERESFMESTGEIVCQKGTTRMEAMQRMRDCIMRNGEKEMKYMQRMANALSSVE